MGCLGDIQDGAGNRLSTPSTPPAWHFLHGRYVPVKTPELPVDLRTPPVAATFSKQNGREALSADSCNLSDSATLGVPSDSPDPTYQGCWPSERYPSDGPDDRDQCSECRCAPGQPHATWCDEAAKLTHAHSNAAPSHRIGTCYLDPDTGEMVMPPDFFSEKELRWMPDKTTAPETTSSADSSHEPDRFAHEPPPYLPVGARSEHPNGVDIIEEPAVETHEDLQGKDADKMVDTFDVPFRLQSWMFESLCEVEIANLHDLIDDHHDLIIEMARDRFRKGYCKYGSTMYSWSPERRLNETLQELADATVYPTSGPLE